LQDISSGRKKKANPQPSYYNSYIGNIQSTPQPSSRPSTINWGTQPLEAERAYMQPTEEEVEKVLEAIHRIEQLPEDQQKMLIEATKEIRYFFDGQVRERFGATRHFNAIRCLNDPQRTQVADSLSIANTQLAGEEFFALNRFMRNYPDIADIQWWSVYKDGSWRLDNWNPEGEHLDTGLNGWGDLVGSVIKLNGRVLTPPETIGFYRTMRLRRERGFLNQESFAKLQDLLGALKQEGTLPPRYEEPLELAHDLGLVGSDGKTLTYQGESMLSEVTARQRKQRQLDETDENVRRIIVPTIFN
jgi:hypothetical protein